MDSEIDRAALSKTCRNVPVDSQKAQDILLRADRLISEYEQFNDLRRQQGKGIGLPGQKIPLHSAKSEQKALARMLEERQEQLFNLSRNRKDAAERLPLLQDFHRKLENSNVFSLQSTWDVVKRCSGLQQLASKFSLHASAGRCSICGGKGKCPPKGKQSSKHVVSVDAVVDSGARWLRVIGIEERRLLQEMAEAGWDWQGDLQEQREIDGAGVVDLDDDAPCHFVPTTVRKLVQAALANRHNYRPPRLHVVFTRICEGSNTEIDRLIRMLRLLGKPYVEIQIDCSNSDFLGTPPPPLEIALQNLVTPNLPLMTSTVNLDCSMLVALASDITHSQMDIKPWHRRDVAIQIFEEHDVGSTLEKHLYPLLRSKKLVCTAKTAQRFWDIVMAIGTVTEGRRAELILPRIAKKDRPVRVSRLQELSAHRIDTDLQLPIEVIEHESLKELAASIDERRLPQSAETVISDLSDLNRDTFLYGWVNQITTITANNTLAKKVMLDVEQHRTHNDDAGPKIWVFPFRRALATKGSPIVSQEPLEELLKSSAVEEWHTGV